MVHAKRGRVTGRVYEIGSGSDHGLERGRVFIRRSNRVSVMVVSVRCSSENDDTASLSVTDDVRIVAVSPQRFDQESGDASENASLIAGRNNRVAAAYESGDNRANGSSISNTKGPEPVGSVVVNYEMEPYQDFEAKRNRLLNHLNDEKKRFCHVECDVITIRVDEKALTDNVISCEETILVITVEKKILRNMYLDFLKWCEHFEKRTKKMTTIIEKMEVFLLWKCV